MLERFTKRARTVVDGAQVLARVAGDTAVRPDHLLLALLQDPDALGVRVLADVGASAQGLGEAVRRLQRARRGSALDATDVAALRAIGIDVEQVLRSVEQNLGTGVTRPGEASPSRGRLPFSPESKKVLELGVREAIALKHGYIGTEHLLLGLLRLDRGVAAEALAEQGITQRSVRAAVVAALRATG